MRTQFTKFLLAVFVMLSGLAYSQTTVSGTVTDENGQPLPGVNIAVVGDANRGTSTDFDGKFSIEASNGESLTFSFVGYTDVTQQVSGNTMNVQFSSGAVLDEVVITGMGVAREKKSIGYAAQELSGEEISTVKVDNVVNSLSGKVSGVQIRGNNNLGGSANFLIRGVSSISGNNQPLFVVDGVPVSNRVNNSSGQTGGSTGYDYGNAASDINPDDVASVNVLKGAAASAIYGSRGQNGVVIITTKKGKAGKVTVDVNSGITVGNIDRSTFLKYQDKYGAGYGPYYGSTGYFEDLDVNGDGIDDLVVPTYEDASYGAPLDGRLVYQWDSFVPESKNYKKAYPYLAGKHTPADFFETQIEYNNSFSISGGSDKSTFRLGYTNYSAKGMLPNSDLNKNTINFSGTQLVSDKFSVGVEGNIVVQRAKGRYSTGYSDNLMTTFRQWWQVNVDILDQKNIYNETGKNYTWNSLASVGGRPDQPLYWDNPYWTRYKNFQTDGRTRFFGNVWGNYKINDWLDVMGRITIDTYNELREERRAVGSVAAPFGVLRSDETSGYNRVDINSAEINYDLMFNFDKDLSDNLNLRGIAGVNIRTEKYDFLQQSTAGGLKIPDLYALSNTVNSNPLPSEILAKKQVNGYYAQASLAYKNMLFLELTDRYDISSALPKGNNAYNYWGASASWLFSSLTDVSWLNYGKLRAGYAEVGNDTGANNTNDTFSIINNFGNATRVSFPSTKQNSDLKPERTKEWEIGLESRVLSNRIGLDFSYYDRSTEDQIIPVQTTTATGFSYKWINAGVVSNKGFEIGLNLVPVRTENFTWSIMTNFSKNKSKVEELYQDVTNIVINSYQGSVSLNATLGQPYGTIRGYGFKYDDNGNKVVNSSGYYISETDQIIGDMNPDWNAGFNNSFKYKNVSLNFLIDVQRGGDVYSLDMHYGQGTGLPDYTGGNNELGNPIRSSVADGGGILNKGVTEDGAVNTTRARADFYGGAYYWGNASRNPGQMTVYDASYVKLRELALSYSLPSHLIEAFLTKATFSLVGRNLWILHKNVPFADPESGLGAGNAQGYLSGSYPTLRTMGLNVNLQF